MSHNILLYETMYRITVEIDLYSYFAWFIPESINSLLCVIAKVENMIIHILPCNKLFSD